MSIGSRPTSWSSSPVGVRAGKRAASDPGRPHPGVVHPHPAAAEPDRAQDAQASAIITAEAAHGGEVLGHWPSSPALRALDPVHDRIESPADGPLRRSAGENRVHDVAVHRRRGVPVRGGFRSRQDRIS
ncbi:MAG TPA: hypothetical protein VGG86_12145 [Roseiarcus sp.]